ncbi:GNAT family acetyltransferase, partial [Bacillus sp. OA1]|nr:GNAT family acetyltransferase [Bacillus sp. OA1]
MMKKLFLIAIACIIIGVIGISQTYEKAVQTAEEGNKEDVIKNETLKNIEVKLDA